MAEALPATDPDDQLHWKLNGETGNEAEAGEGRKPAPNAGAGDREPTDGDP